MPSQGATAKTTNSHFDRNPDRFVLIVHDVEDELKRLGGLFEKARTGRVSLSRMNT
jgi:hypothetical protein